MGSVAESLHRVALALEPMATSYEKPGLVAFPVDGAPRSFRFAVTAADNKLRIWIEDCVTKEQWQTNQLALEDFVTLDTAIPQAKAKDYAARVVECLVPTNDAEKVTHSLSRPASDGSRVLCVGFTLQMGTFTTAIEYTFTLPAIPLEATDLLASRMRDLETIITDLKAQNDRLSATSTQLQKKYDELVKKVESNDTLHAIRDAVVAVANEVSKPPLYVRANSTSQVMQNKQLVWKADSLGNSSAPVQFGTNGDITFTEAGTLSSSPVQFETNGDITFTEAGTYELTMVLTHATTSAGTAFELLHGNKSLLAPCGHSQGHPVPLPVHYVLTAKTNDKLSVFYRGNNYAPIGSYVTIFKLSSSQTRMSKAKAAVLTANVVQARPGSPILAYVASVDY